MIDASLVRCRPRVNATAPQCEDRLVLDNDCPGSLSNPQAQRSIARDVVTARTMPDQRSTRLPRSTAGVLLATGLRNSLCPQRLGESSCVKPGGNIP
jgi:hypothetical protein